MRTVINYNQIITRLILISQDCVVSAVVIAEVTKFVVVNTSSQVYSGQGHPFGQFSLHGQFFKVSSYSLLQTALQRWSSCEQSSMQSRYTAWTFLSQTIKFGSLWTSRQLQKSDIQPLRGQLLSTALGNIQTTLIVRIFATPCTCHSVDLSLATIRTATEAWTIKFASSSFDYTVEYTRCVTFACSQTIYLFNWAVIAALLS